MRKLTTLAITIGLIGLGFTFPALEKEKYTVDTKASKLEWIGKKVTGQHQGTVKIKEGMLMVEDGKIVNGSATIDMTTIENNDLSGEYKQKLEGHLKSPDFFNVKEYPEAVFEIKSVKKLKEKTETGATHQVKGDLTIKGITNEIVIPAYIATKENKLVAYADFNIDRTRWKVKYGSDEFYDDLGDKMIYDKVNLKLSLAAKK